MVDDTQNPSAQYESDHDQSGHSASSGHDHGSADQGHGSDDHGHGSGGHGSHDHHADGDGRVTSPMQEFSSGQVTTGLVVLAIGLAVVFGLPFLL